MKGEDIFMSNINLCKGDIVCRYWSEFTVFTVSAIGNIRTWYRTILISPMNS